MSVCVYCSKTVLGRSYIPEERPPTSEDFAQVAVQRRRSDHTGRSPRSHDRHFTAEELLVGRAQVLADDEIDFVGNIILVERDQEGFDQRVLDDNMLIPHGEQRFGEQHQMEDIALGTHRHGSCHEEVHVLVAKCCQRLIFDIAGNRLGSTHRAAAAH